MTIVFKEYSEEEKEEMKIGEFEVCERCVYKYKPCIDKPCTSLDREDKKDGYYIEVPD